MALWVLFAIMTAAAMLTVLLPLRIRAPRADGIGADRAVYRDQLAELDRDAADGRIAGEEAVAARAEIARRLIAAERRPDGLPGTGGMPGPTRRAGAAAILVAALAMPILAVGLYLYSGAPGLPGQPLATRTPAASEVDIVALVARIERHLAANPGDARGWSLIAPVYMRLGRPLDAASAWRNVIRISGPDAESQSRLGEAIVAAENGIVTAEAQRAFEAALRAAPGAPLPRYYLALAHQQDGDTQGAIARWRALLDDAPPDAPWRGIVADALVRAGARPPQAADTETGGGPGPGADDVAAAAQLDAADRRAMIAGMVARLADRLAAEPDDLDGWLRLIRAYMVMGENKAATAAARNAWEAITGDEGRQRIAALAQELGIELGVPVAR